MAQTFQILKTIGLLSLLLAARAENNKHEEHKELNAFLRPPPIDDTRHTNLKTILKPVNDQTQNYNHREKKHLQESVAQSTDRPSFMSQITSWLFPFAGNADSSVSASEKVAYGPPSLQSSQQHNRDDCNPCNLEPWIPVQKNTVIGFVPPQQFNAPPHLPTSNYGPPNLNGPIGHISQPSSQYGSPSAINHQAGHINSHNNLHVNVGHDILPPSNQYGPPVHGHHSGHINVQSNGHVNSHEILKVPPLSSQYGPPSSIGQHVGNINLQSSIPIADSQNGHSIVSNVPHGPPLHLDAISPPKTNYRPSAPILPLKPGNQYGVPNPIRNHGPPKEFLGPPTNLRPVSSSHFGHHQSNSGHHSSFGHHTSTGHQLQLGSQTKHTFSKHHHNGPLHISSNTKFAPPPQFSQRPPKSHGPPEHYASLPKPLGQYGTPFNKYSSSQSTRLYIPAKFEEHPLLPPKINGGHLSTNIGAISSNYGPPVNNFHPPGINYGPPDAVLPTQFTPPKIVTPTSEEYIPPPHQLPLDNSPLDSGGSVKQYLKPPKPIPFPNLHPGPLPPLHKAQPFYSPLPPTTIEIHETDTGNYKINSYNSPVLNSYNSNPTFNHQEPIVHNDNLIKEVISSLPETTDTVYGHHHHDTSISETVNRFKVHNENNIGASLNSYGISQDSYHVSQNHQIPEHQQKVEQIQVVPSVSVAEYTSSVEYPINLIQSPLVDIIATENKNEDYDERHNSEQSEEYLPPTTKNDITTAEANQHSPLNHQSPSTDDETYSLSNNPIIVENEETENEKPADTYSSASTRNETVHKEHNINSERTHYNSIHDKQENLLKNHNLNGHASSLADSSVSTVSHTSVEIQPSLQTSADGSTIFSADVINKLEEQIFDNFNQYSNHKYESTNTNSAPAHSGPELPLLYLNPSPPNKASKEFNFVTPVSSNIHTNEQDLLTPPTLDYTSWVPSPGPLSTSMLPPAPNAGGVWLPPIINTFTLTEEVPEGMTPPPPSPVNVESEEKKNKKIQIIIPYTSNSRPKPFQSPSTVLHQTNIYQDQQNSLINQAVVNSHKTTKDKTNTSVDSTLFWLTQPQSDYHHEEESKQVTATQKLPKFETSTTSSNIEDLLGREKIKIYESDNIPFDVLRLQQNIDKWTAQEFSNLVTKPEETDKASTLSHLIPSKKIPHEYLTTTELSNEISSTTETTTKYFTPQQNFKPGKSLFFDYEAAGTFNHLSETNLHNITVISNFNNTLYESNLVIPEESKSTVVEDTDSTTETLLPETTLPLTTDEQEVMTSPSYTKTSLKPSTTQKPIWEKIQLAISPLTNEKVYVVTPQPWNHDETTPASVWNYVPKHLTASKVLDLKTDELGFSSPRFSIRPSPSKSKFEKKVNEKKDTSLKSIFSEWSQAINNLETTTSKSSTREKLSTSTTASSTESLLWGLMDITAYTPPPGSSVEIHSGHSKITK